MRKRVGILGALVIGGGLAFWVLTSPRGIQDTWPANAGDPEAGALVFAAAGCGSCHADPAPDADPTVLSGGHAFATGFGTFYAPNISPDVAQGIGGWSLPEFARAVTRGVSPQGEHYYPAFPYTTYSRMTAQDVADVHAYIRTLPATTTASRAHDVPFPFSVRRSLGLWKLLYLDDAFHMQVPASPQIERGRYLAEALGHCGECHTARTALGGLDASKWLAGAPNPSGKGRIPNITPGALDWSDTDLVAYFTTGLTPDYDSAGGEMAAVIRNLAKLPESDRAALAEYLRSVPALP